MLKKIIHSAKKAWKGEEKLWKVFWLWFVVLYPMSFILGFFGTMFVEPWAMMASTANPSAGYIFFAKTISGLFIFLGLIMIFIYPIIFIFSMHRCAKNTNSENIILPISAKLFFIPFIFLHLFYSYILKYGILGFISTFTFFK